MIVLSIVFIYSLSFFADQHLSDPDSIWRDWRFVVCFLSLCFMNSNASLFSMASDIAVERDWVVTLCRNNHQLLSRKHFPYSFVFGSIKFSYAHEHICRY